MRALGSLAAAGEGGEGAGVSCVGSCWGYLCFVVAGEGSVRMCILYTYDP